MTFSYGPTLTKFDRDPLGNVYVFEGNDVKKRAPSATMFTTLGSLGGISPSRLKVWGVDDVEVVAADSLGFEFLRWDSDRQAFQRKGVKLHFTGALDIVPGTPARAEWARCPSVPRAKSWPSSPPSGSRGRRLLRSRPTWRPAIGACGR